MASKYNIASARVAVNAKKNDAARRSTQDKGPIDQKAPAEIPARASKLVVAEADQ